MHADTFASRPSWRDREPYRNPAERESRQVNFDVATQAVCQYLALRGRSTGRGCVILAEKRPETPAEVVQNPLPAWGC
jgi:hypothetical protein